ncbi:MULTISPECIES: photosystem I assembly protein Ycf4 [Arthrospira]|uniref:Photosystem I assembly protein Ycf4 n=1 Tax=Limnospira platensis NIES-46 TaxID=1236695 RepID=A0A5M3T4E0_LIMPL|nr:MULTISPECIES: photosystem I assembly protein Ycf4 [Arthrospira]AMW28906.1 photosystem I assembly protein [Arthrospira platensis YZ]KDR56028.1 photosystem I assembly protein [Arthrospira platensis str. Paraca]MBD2711475.1 photosystem I assembly protein Ycf4 [Arthrospira platensis FACHB-835]MDF2212661.1 photosystem I assembly protein Ycf4 [Arthrospira platensis NCB002]MDT9183951.1 photosystem I assembly protein Ycf4 [Limnospira sp. PMC 289.06]MDT9296156.1 photosystem I assembly protein Ycf4 
MNTQTEKAAMGDRILEKQILGSRRFSNYFWATTITVGGVGFLLAGLSSYLGKNLLPFADPSQLIFLPQGLVMGLYGTAAILLATYLWLVVIWDLGGGYNKFDQETGEIQIFRWGFPGKNRRVEFNCNRSQVQSIRVDIKEGLSPRRALYLKLKDRREIPLTRVGQPMALSDLENDGAQLAKFLQVPLEGL